MKPPVMEEVPNFGKKEQDQFLKTGELPEGAVYTTYQPAEGIIMPMFPTPFLRGKLELDIEEVAQSCRHLIGEIEQGDVFQEYTTYFDESARVAMHETEWFHEFSNRIKDSYVAYCSNVFNIPVSHLERDAIHLFAWISIYKGPHSHATHNHAQPLTTTH